MNKALTVPGLYLLRGSMSYWAGSHEISKPPDWVSKLSSTWSACITSTSACCVGITFTSASCVCITSTSTSLGEESPKLEKNTLVRLWSWVKHIEQIEQAWEWIAMKKKWKYFTGGYPQESFDTKNTHLEHFGEFWSIVKMVLGRRQKKWK